MMDRLWKLVSALVLVAAPTVYEAPAAPSATLVALNPLTQTIELGFGLLGLALSRRKAIVR